MKRRWLVLILVSVLVLSLAGGAVFFRQDLAVRFAPRLVLSQAIQEALEDLEDRFSDGPAPVLLKALSPEGNQLVKLKLDTTEPLLGVVRYDMNVYTQASPARILAEGSVFTGGKLLDLSLYLDGDFAAVSSRELVEGQFYGITYEKFADDLRSSDVLKYLIGEAKLRELQEGLSSLQSMMSRSYQVPQLRPADVPGMLYGVLALEPQVAREAIALSGTRQICYAVRFAATGEEIAAAAKGYLDQLPEEMAQLVRSLTSGNSGVDVTFFLKDEKLVKLSGRVFSQEEALEFDALLGPDPEENPVSLELSTRTGSLSLKADTRQEDDLYQEVLQITHLGHGQQTGWVLDYSWNDDTGELRMNAEKNGEKSSLRMNLLPSDGGFTLKTDDFEGLKGFLTGKKKNRVTICTMEVTQGREVAVPGYKPFDQWSMEDLMMLLRGFGGLLGLRFSA